MMHFRSLRLPALLLLLAIGATASGTPAAAEDAEQKPIFRRFALTRDKPDFWQALFEVPLYLRPQGNADARIERNLGFNYVTSYRPGNRIYFSRSIGVTRMEWHPVDSTVEKVAVKTFDVTLILNHLYRSTLVTSFGLGLGVMDGLVTFNDERDYSTRLEPFIPIQFGMGVRLGGVQVGLKVSQFSFFRSNPVISNTRVLLGVGFNY